VNTATAYIYMLDVSIICARHNIVLVTHSAMVAAFLDLKLTENNSNIFLCLKALNKQHK
jgi:hypothetical protein